MRRRLRALLRHPVVRTLLFERFLITGSATLAFSALAMGHVRLSEIPSLMDLRILTLFLVLTVAVELGRPPIFSIDWSSSSSGASVRRVAWLSPCSRSPEPSRPS
jgi:hypothetical protein